MRGLYASTMYYNYKFICRIPTEQEIHGLSDPHHMCGLVEGKSTLYSKACVQPTPKGLKKNVLYRQVSFKYRSIYKNWSQFGTEQIVLYIQVVL